MYSPETEARIKELSQATHVRELTQEECKEVIALVREGRRHAATAVKVKKVAKGALPQESLDDLLEGF